MYGRGHCSSGVAALVTAVGTLAKLALHVQPVNAKDRMCTAQVLPLVDGFLRGACMVAF